MSKKHEEISGVPIFCEFLNTAIHSFLYSRGLYPSQAFEMRKKYGVPVQICVHYEVRGYIDSITRSLSIMLDEHRVERLEVVVINQKKGLTKEKLIIEPMSLPRFELAVLTIEELFRLEQSLRASLLKILQNFASLPDLPSSPECTWQVRVHAKMALYMELLEKQKVAGELFWIFIEDNEENARSKQKANDGGDDGPFLVLPLKNIKSRFLEVHLRIEDYSCQEL